MTQTENPNDISSVIAEASPENPYRTQEATDTLARKVSSRKVRQKFHAYNASKNCRDFGKEHKYVNRGSYLKCTRCGSSRTLKTVK